MSAALKLPKTDMTDAEWQTRCELAALYHVVNHLGWTDLINTHMSARIPGEPNTFLINNYGEMFDEITASSLVKMDMDGNVLRRGRQVQQRRLHHPQRRLQGTPGRDVRDAHAHPRRRRRLDAANGLRPISQDALQVYRRCRLSRVRRAGLAGGMRGARPHLRAAAAASCC